MKRLIKWDKLKRWDWKIYNITKSPYTESNQWPWCCKVVFIELDWETFVYDDDLNSNDFDCDDEWYDNAIYYDIIYNNDNRIDVLIDDFYSLNPRYRTKEKLKKIIKDEFLDK